MPNFSVYDLSFHFLNTFYEVEPDAKTKVDTIVAFKKALNFGWTTEAIGQALRALKGATSIPDIDKLFNKSYTGMDRNLIDSGNTFFYHNLLRCCPAPPTISWDINTGDIVSVPTEDHYLEMRASITAKQLVDYYVAQLQIEPNEVNENRYKGSMVYLVDKYGLDLTLYMIDITRDMIYSEHLPKPTTPMSVAENMYQAKEILDQKISETRAAEDDKIVYKKRIFAHRSRG